MSDYAPTTEEIREAVVDSKATPGDQARSETWWRLAFRRWYEAEIRKAKAEAWDEAIGEASEQGTIQAPDNPYRADQIEEAAP